jgi:hypothetical protein
MTTNIQIEAPTTKALIALAFNHVLTPYLDTAWTERERKDTDGNVIEVRNPAKDRLEFALRSECNLFWNQLYGNTADPRQPQQYSAIHNVLWAEERLAPLQKRLDQGFITEAESARHETYMRAKDENLKLYRYYLVRFSAAKQQYETIIEKPYQYETYEKKAPIVRHSNGLQAAIGADADDDPFFAAQDTQRVSVTHEGANATAQEDVAA